MKLDYDRINTGDLRGTTRADYLAALDATLSLQEGKIVIYEEPSFPVVELARGLHAWLTDADPGDFEFDSMSFEVVGSLRILRTPTSWTFGSVFIARHRLGLWTGARLFGAARTSSGGSSGTCGPLASTLTS